MEDASLPSRLRGIVSQAVDLNSADAADILSRINLLSDKADTIIASGELDDEVLQQIKATLTSLEQVLGDDNDDDDEGA